MRDTKRCQRCRLPKPIAAFVSVDGAENPRGRCCRDCHAALERERRVASLQAEAAKIPKLKIIYGQWWEHWAWPEEFRATLYDERAACPYCGQLLPPAYIRKGRAGARAHLDHMDPLALGGEDSIRNAVYVCERCNGQKSDMLFVDWLATLAPDAEARARAIYAEKHGHPPEAFSPGDAEPRATGISFELCLSEAELREMYPEPAVDGPPSAAKIVITVSVDDAHLS
jgi:5-methylcytosine-specific restriction endonuclease McrA